MILNISGRTDLVAFYTPWLMNRFKEGYVYSRNPMYPEVVMKYDLSPSKIDAIVFCSKNYKPILKYIDEINSKYNIICHYTITAYDNDVEKNVPSIDESIETLIKLSNKIGKDKIIWRFDPVLKTKKYTIDYLIEKFDYMASILHNYVSRVLFSYVEMYKKLETNMSEIIPFTNDEKIKIAYEFGKIAKKYNLYIQTCACKEDYSQFGIHKSGCVTKEILEICTKKRYKNIPLGKTRENCNCVSMRDIGAYETCPHGCKYCYANKNHEQAYKNFKSHNPNSPILFGNISSRDIIKNAVQTNYIDTSVEQLSLF